MTPDRYFATLEDCLSKVWEAQLKLEAAFDALVECHVAIRAAQSIDKLDAALKSDR